MAVVWCWREKWKEERVGCWWLVAGESMSSFARERPEWQWRKGFAVSLCLVAFYQPHMSEKCHGPGAKHRRAIRICFMWLYVEGAANAKHALVHFGIRAGSTSSAFHSTTQLSPPWAWTNVIRLPLSHQPLSTLCGSWQHHMWLVMKLGKSTKLLTLQWSITAAKVLTQLPFLLEQHRK